MTANKTLLKDIRSTLSSGSKLDVVVEVALTGTISDNTLDYLPSDQDVIEQSSGAWTLTLEGRRLLSNALGLVTHAAQRQLQSH